MNDNNTMFHHGNNTLVRLSPRVDTASQTPDLRPPSPPQVTFPNVYILLYLGSSKSTS